MNFTNNSHNPLVPRMEESATFIRKALLSGLIRREDSAVIFYDLDILERRIRYLMEHFPAGTMHGLAIKANPLHAILTFARDISPEVGIEAASIGEVMLGLDAGYSPDRIVFDSPVKTYEDLEFALEKGIRINIDNLDEAERVEQLIENRSSSGSTTPALSPSIGLRINPQVGSGSIQESSVAGIYSKFGVPIRTKRGELERLFLTKPWLNGVHLHVGSQGCSPDLLTEGIGVLYDFIMEVNPRRIDAGLAPVTVFDIGGGLPISYHAGITPPSLEDYAAKIRERAPEIIDFQLITEFGRWVFTNPGWTVSRVEYVKHDEELQTAMMHVGADLFVRECLNPVDWKHDYTVLDKEGNLKPVNTLHPTNLAGPLCFSGDFIAKGVRLPAISAGDHIIIHDTGGYTFSMWSRYNSRLMPKIIGIRDGELRILRERESYESLRNFWR